MFTKTCPATLIVVAAALVAAGPALATAPRSASPGAEDRVLAVESRCPTFTWEAVPGALFSQLVAYRLPDSLVEEAGLAAELRAEDEALYAEVAGGAGGWTPAAEQCLASGGRYAWFVRAVLETAGDEVVAASEWSSGRYFAVAEAPSADEVRRALEVLRRWEASAEPPAGTAVAQPAAALTGPATYEDDGGAASKSVTSASAAVRGLNPEADLEAYGVIGVSASVFGAGVGAANLEGGADLVLDGSLDGTTDLSLSEWGAWRSSPSDATFYLQNFGGGLHHLDVVGNITGQVLGGTELVVDGATVIGSGGVWTGAGDMLPCSGCVTSGDLADESVTSAKIELGGVTTSKVDFGAVTTDKLADLAVTGAKLAAAAVTHAKIAAGAVDTAQLRSGAVTGDKILDASVTMSDLAVDSVGSPQIELGGVRSEDIDGGAVTTGHLGDGAVTGAKIAVNAVSATHIADGAISSGDLAPSSVTSFAIQDGTITAADLADESVTSSKIEIGGVGASHLDSGAVTSAAILDGSVTSADLAAGAVGSAGLADNAVTSAKIANGAVTTADLANISVTGTKIADATVASRHLAEGAVGSAAILDGTLTAGDAHPTGGIYASKSAVYEGTHSLVIPGYSCGSPSAECDDANDLPLSWSCEEIPYLMRLVGTRAESWNDAVSPARFTCTVCNDGSTPQVGEATILCVSVPGP